MVFFLFQLLHNEKTPLKFGSQKSPIGFHANLKFGVLVLSQFEKYRLGAYIHR